MRRHSGLISSFMKMTPSAPAPGLPDPARMIGPAALEARLQAVAAQAPGMPAPGMPDGSAGLFGPGSPLWRVDRESALFLGAGRALLLQLAHPWVAAGVAQHSRALADPLGRFHRTFGSVYAMVFGDVAQAVAAARALHRRHAGVVGRLADGPGTPYRANQADALAWVHATLCDTALLVHDAVLPPLDAADRDSYWREAVRMAGLFGLDPADLPGDWLAFRRRFDQQVTALPPVCADARQVAWGLFRGGPRWTRLPGWYLDLTAALLPAALADGFGLRRDAAACRRAERVLRLAGRLYPLLPARLRLVGPWWQAMERVRGRPRPSLPTRLSNRLWIGRSDL